MEFNSPRTGVRLDNIRFSSTTVVPEPSTWTLLSAGGVMVSCLGRRRDPHHPGKP